MRCTTVGVALKLLAIAGGLLVPNAAHPQAVCSAPHSAPTLVQNGSMRTLPAGSGWMQVSVYRQETDEFFNHLGDRQPFLANSRFDTRSIFLTGAFGLARGLEVWAQLPFHHLTVESVGEPSTSTGIGDIRAALRAGAELFGFSLPLAVRAGLKVPGSDFPVDATVLPLTEGQFDFETSIEAGSTLGPTPLFVSGWAGYRWRTENMEAARRPGNERFAHIALGGQSGRMAAEIAIDALWGNAPRAQGIRLDAEKRRLLQIIPTFGYRVGSGRLEFTSQIPLSGRNLPRGIGLSLGYRLTWGL